MLVKVTKDLLVWWHSIKQYLFSGGRTQQSKSIRFIYVQHWILFYPYLRNILSFIVIAP